MTPVLDGVDPSLDGVKPVKPVFAEVLSVGWMNRQSLFMQVHPNHCSCPSPPPKLSM